MRPGDQSSGWSSGDILIFLLILFLWAWYLYAVVRRRGNGHAWSGWRVLLFSTGCLLLAVAWTPSLVEFAHRDFRGHMVQHLLLGMLAPLGLVLGAPVTLILANLPRRAARLCAHWLNSAPVGLLTHPITTLLLNLGGMYLLYLTPLYAASLHDPRLHRFVHLHFLIAGCLFTWAIAGPASGPRRPSWYFRLLVLFLSMAGHAILAKLMYGYGWPRDTPHSWEQIQNGAKLMYWEQIQNGAKLMYYAGDLAEILLLIALLLTWKQSRKPGQYRQQLR